MTIIFLCLMYLNKIELVLREKWNFYSQILCLDKNLIRQNRLVFNVKEKAICCQDVTKNISSIETHKFKRSISCYLN